PRISPMPGLGKRQAARGSSDAGRLLGKDQTHLLGIVDIDGDLATVGEPAEQELVGERRTYRVLYQPGHRPRAHLGIEALAREVVAQGLGEARLDFLLLELLLELHEELVHDPQDDLA